jgi:hypothetical protein
MKDFPIYQKRGTYIYIHKGTKKTFDYHKKKWVNRKTFWYGIRKNSKSGLMEILGIIRFNGAWRQFVFEPQPDTFWSKGCLEKINEFLDKLNKEFRNKHKK